MDPKRHYKKGDSQPAKYFQVRILHHNNITLSHRQGCISKFV